MEGAIPTAVATAAREFGDITALAEPDGPRLSYRQLHGRVMTVARAHRREPLTKTAHRG